jgi:hypothetical protein
LADNNDVTVGDPLFFAPTQVGERVLPLFRKI